ncbi:ABC transporter ATP-binding protein [Vagococcus zengguangii]|uniref:ABC transporter ATP-binding protein n=1 Tax=Vagococcus zengguangii TaxID=2571750 RepID=UPI00110995AD|nr:ABC transporter ATP-binding protein [Vagococcus zengguangii]TLG79753.1 ABC transporter ATP-binding protein [Vagococcus zengguangii]
MTNILEINHLEKAFGPKKVIEGVNLTLKKGKIYGLIGQNGAGKTTVMNMILGQLLPDEGQIFVNGERVIAGGETTNRYIGYCPDVPNFYGYMTAKEYLQFCASITSFKTDNLELTIQGLLERVGLAQTEKVKISTYSRGMKQRLGIAQALLNQPLLLICDEPTSALDPRGRKEVMDLLASLKEEMSVILSTHILSDIERVCDHIGILANGKLVREERLQDVLAEHQTQAHYTLKFSEAWAYEAYLKEMTATGVQLVSHDQEQLMITTAESQAAILDKLSQHHYPIESLVKEQQTLEKLFLEETNA